MENKLGAFKWEIAVITTVHFLHSTKKMCWEKTGFIAAHFTTKTLQILHPTTYARGNHQWCSKEKVVLKISQNSQGTTCVGVSF